MGGGIFWIKFWPSLFGALTYLVVARLILLLDGRGFALVLGFLPFVFGYFLHVHYMFQPNFLEVFFWTAMAYGLMLVIRTGKTAGFYVAGVCWGLGMMSKYSVIFFAISLLIGLLLTKERKVLRNRHFYYALLIGLGIFLPNLVWQGIHGFPVVYHMKELQRQQLENVSQLGFLLDQLSFNLPGIVVWISGLYWIARSPAGRPYRFIGWAVLIVMAFLLTGHGKSYYGMGAYPILFGFGAVALEQWTDGRAGRLRWLRFALVAFSVVTGCYLDTVTLPILPPQQLAAYYTRNPIFRQLGFLRWEDRKDHPLPQDFADMLSWREMTEKVSKVYQTLDSAQRSRFVLDGDNYGETGAMDYYGAPYHLPPAMGHSANYLLWTPSDFYKNNIFILTTDARDEIHGDFFREFRSAAVVDNITNPYARESGSYIDHFAGRPG